MTTREKLQAIVDGSSISRTVPLPYGRRMELFTTAQIIPMLEQAYRLAIQDAANICEDVGSRTAFLAEERLRRMAEQSGGEG